MSGHVELWLWDYIHLGWKQAPYCVRTIRMVGAGQVAAGAHELYWMKCSPGVASAEVEISDAIAALEPVVLSTFHTDRNGWDVSCNPPMHFDTGIYLETFDNMTAITFGYL